MRLKCVCTLTLFFLRVSITGLLVGVQTNAHAILYYYCCCCCYIIFIFLLRYKITALTLTGKVLRA